MLEKVVIMTQYRKFLELLTSKNTKEIIKGFNKFDKFIKKQYQKGLNDELFVTIRLSCICHTVEVLQEEDIRLKDFAIRWNKDTVQRAYELLKKLSALKRQEDTDSEQYKILFGHFMKLIEDEEDAALKLYLLQVHKKSPTGQTWYTSKLKTENELLKAETEEEIDYILRSPSDNLLKIQELCAKSSKS